MTHTPPALPAANAELRRLFAAGRPPDGSNVGLMRALVAAELVVPLHPQGRSILLMARPHAHRADREEVVLHAFTSHELAGRWADGVRDAPPEKMAVASSNVICREAIHRGVDVIEIDRGSAGYAMRFRGMIDLLTRTAFDGERSFVFEAIPIKFGEPKTPPPPVMLDTLRAIGLAHGLTRLEWSMAWVGEAPAEMQLVYAPYPTPAFIDEVIERMNAMTRDRFTASTHDAASHRVPERFLRRLI